jgi:hypothetical protein
VTDINALVFSTLAYFAATVLDRDLGELRLRDLVAHVRARSAWPHPLRSSTDRADPPVLTHPFPCHCGECQAKAKRATT